MTVFHFHFATFSLLQVARFPDFTLNQQQRPLRKVSFRARVSDLLDFQVFPSLELLTVLIDLSTVQNTSMK